MSVEPGEAVADAGDLRGFLWRYLLSLFLIPASFSIHIVASPRTGQGADVASGRIWWTFALANMVTVVTMVAVWYRPVRSWVAAHGARKES